MGADGIVMHVEDVSKRFRRRRHLPGHGSLKTLLLRGILGRKGSTAEEWRTALDGVSFQVAAGEGLGIIGPNGGGKTTLLRILAGIYRASSGRVRIQGRVAALIELGAGFHPEFTGRENVLVNGVILGLKPRDVRLQCGEILQFAELEEVADEPVRTYSSGMLLRLGFSVAVHTNPDVLLVDEVIAVGDASFQQRCLERIERMRRDGMTLVLVSHSLETVERLCEDAIWLNRQIRERGPAPRVARNYLLSAQQRAGASPSAPATEEGSP